MSHGNSEVTPYLSIVVTARNDDHGGNLLGRMQLFVNGWIAHARAFRIPSELVIVEWNPPAGRPFLAEALTWPDDLGPCEVRFVLVPPEVHHRYAHSASLPLYQMVAKNAGIRRARGQFVLATNIDILFSSELAGFLAARELEPRRMYRIDRYDAMSAVPPEAAIEAQLDYCRTHLIRVNRREGTFDVSPEGAPGLSAVDVTRAGSGITFGAGLFPVEQTGQTWFRFAGPRAEVLIAATSRMARALILEIDAGPALGPAPLSLEVVTDSKQVLLREWIKGRRRIRIPLPDPAPSRLWLQAREAGSGVGADPRILTMRVFEVDWERRFQLPKLHVARRVAYAWHALQGVIAKLAENEPVTTLTFRVPALVRRMSRGYIAWGGITGILRHGIPHALRRLVRSGGRKAGPAVAETPTALRPETVPVAMLHTNGCGDFTLMAREHWYDLRGYPEFDTFSMNLDSILCFAAHYGGVREEVLADPMRIYHIEHATGSGWTPEGQQRLFERLGAKGIPYIVQEQVLEWASQMRRLKAPMIFNGKDWGLAGIELQETSVCRKAAGSAK